MKDGLRSVRSSCRSGPSLRRRSEALTEDGREEGAPRWQDGGRRGGVARGGEGPRNGDGGGRRCGRSFARGLGRQGAFLPKNKDPMTQQHGFSTTPCRPMPLPAYFRLQGTLACPCIPVCTPSHPCMRLHTNYRAAPVDHLNLRASPPTRSVGRPSSCQRQSGIGQSLGMT